MLQHYLVSSVGIFLASLATYAQEAGINIEFCLPSPLERRRVTYYEQVGIMFRISNRVIALKNVCEFQKCRMRAEFELNHAHGSSKPLSSFVKGECVTE